jgi:hypothetical protein
MLLTDEVDAAATSPECRAHRLVDLLLAEVMGNLASFRRCGDRVAQRVAGLFLEERDEHSMTRRCASLRWA